MTRARRWMLLLMGLAIALVVVSCGRAKPSEPPDEGQAPPEGAKTRTVAVYFSDWQAQHLVPEERSVPEVEGVELADRVVREILAGPTDPHLHRTIPASVRLVEPVTVRESIAQVNLSKEFLEVRGATGVQMALGSLIQSLTDLPGIRQVQILVDGKGGFSMDEGVTLDEPIGRGFYGEYRFFPDPERAQYLEERVNKGLDAWRQDPGKTLQWEGRMFGFTAAELEQAIVEVDAEKAQAKVTHAGKTYLVELTKQGLVWVITGISVA